MITAHRKIFHKCPNINSAARKVIQKILQLTFILFLTGLFLTECIKPNRNLSLSFPQPSSPKQVKIEKVNLELERQNRLYFDVLPNGMKMLIVEMPESTTSYGAIAIRVGGRYEPESHAGISHLLEHMIFKEDPETKPLSRIQETGGKVNAITELEFTTYYFSVRPEYFNASMEALVRMVLNPVFTEEELKKEKEVVIEELQRAKNDPRSMVLVDIINEIFPDSPVSNIVIGNKRSIKNVTLEDLKVFHTSYYVPENMVVVAAGNLRVEEMVSYLLTMLGNLERRPAPDHIFSTPHIAVNELEKKIPVNQELLIYGGILPEITMDDYPAIEVLEALIFSGVNSRLYRKIVIEKGITDDLYNIVFPLSDCRIWAVFMSLNPGDTDKALNITREEIGSVLQGEFSESEFEDAKKAIISKLFIDLEAPEDLANFMLTNLLLRNRIITPFEHVRDLCDLKRDDLVKMAKRYFIPENLGTISLIPAKGLSKWYIALKFLATKKL